VTSVPSIGEVVSDESLAMAATCAAWLPTTIRSPTRTSVVKAVPEPVISALDAELDSVPAPATPAWPSRWSVPCAPDPATAPMVALVAAERCPPMVPSPLTLKAAACTTFPLRYHAQFGEPHFTKRATRRTVTSRSVTAARSRAPRCAATACLP
jgi:hypothetical protein